MLYFAVSNLEKIESIPPMVWLKAAGMLAAFVAIVVVLRKVARMNKVLLAVIVFIAVTFLGFSWIYERNEPRFMTPLVQKIAPFFPSKSGYEDKQAR